MRKAKNNFKNHIVSSLKKEGMNEVIIPTFTDFIVQFTEKNNPFIFEELDKLLDVVLKKYFRNHEDYFKKLDIEIEELNEKAQILLNNPKQFLEKFEFLLNRINFILNKISLKQRDIKTMVSVDLWESDIFDDTTYLNFDRNFKKRIPEKNLEEIEKSISYCTYYHLTILNHAIHRLDFIKNKLLLNAHLFNNVHLVQNFKFTGREPLQHFENKMKEYMNTDEFSEFLTMYEQLKEIIEKINVLENEHKEAIENSSIQALDFSLLASNYRMICTNYEIIYIKYLKENDLFEYKKFMQDIREEVGISNGLIEIKKILETGENQNVEFKSSLIHDLKRNEKSKDLPEVIAKEIVGFLNADGGSLLIGVEDNGNICGIEHDFQYVKNKNIDGFRLRILDLIDKKIGIEYKSLIFIKFHSVENKTICQLEIKKSEEEAFYEGVFYLRTDASNRELTTKQYKEYIKIKAT